MVVFFIRDSVLRSLLFFGRSPGLFFGPLFKLFQEFCWRRFSDTLCPWLRWRAHLEQLSLQERGPTVEHFHSVQSTPKWMNTICSTVGSILLGSLFSYRMLWLESAKSREKPAGRGKVTGGQAMFLVGVVGLGPREGDRCPGSVGNIKRIASTFMAKGSDQHWTSWPKMVSGSTVAS